jgi:hypothetical protein
MRYTLQISAVIRRSDRPFFHNIAQRFRRALHAGRCGIGVMVIDLKLSAFFREFVMSLLVIHQKAWWDWRTCADRPVE